MMRGWMRYYPHYSQCMEIRHTLILVGHQQVSCTLCVHVCVCVCVYVCMHVCVHACACACVSARMFVCVHAFVYMSVCMCAVCSITSEVLGIQTYTYETLHSPVPVEFTHNI